MGVHVYIKLIQLVQILKHFQNFKIELSIVGNKWLSGFWVI